jgi:signal transduction histidine kinase
VALFRAAQEALGNVVRHADARSVEIVLAATDGAIAVTISDDGIGIDAGDAAKTGCLGLLGIQELLAARGGAVTVQRARTRGTVVTCTLPLPGRSEARPAARRSALH